MDNRTENESGFSKAEVAVGQTWRATFPEGHVDLIVKDIVTMPGSKDPARTYQAAVLDAKYPSETEPVPQEGFFPVSLLPKMAELVEG